jgi:hypothetical protein
MQVLQRNGDEIAATAFAESYGGHELPLPQIKAINFLEMTLLHAATGCL